MHHELTNRQKLAWRLETACSSFETLRSLVDGSLKLLRHEAERPDLAAAATIWMALAQSFVANVARARRLFEHAGDDIPLSREDRKKFLSALASVTKVRDVNEHGFDARNVRSPPQLHLKGEGFLDATSLNIIGPNEIFMGPLNLPEIYLVVADARTQAGWGSLPAR